MEQSPGLKLIYILMNDRDFMRVTCDQVGGCDGIVVNPLPHWLYIAFSLLSRLWVQILHFHSVGPLPMPNSSALRCLLLLNFNFNPENSIFNLRTFIHLL